MTYWWHGSFIIFLFTTLPRSSLRLCFIFVTIPYYYIYLNVFSISICFYNIEIIINPINKYKCIKINVCPWINKWNNYHQLDWPCFALWYCLLFLLSSTPILMLGSFLKSFFVSQSIILQNIVKHLLYPSNPSLLYYLDIHYCSWFPVYCHIEYACLYNSLIWLIFYYRHFRF